MKNPSFPIVAKLLIFIGILGTANLYASESLESNALIPKKEAKQVFKTLPSSLLEENCSLEPMLEAKFSYVNNQENSGWCDHFAIADLYNYLISKKNQKKFIQKRISVMHLAQHFNSNASDRRLSLGIKQFNTAYDYLKNKSLLAESSFPFDPKVFENLKKDEITYLSPSQIQLRLIKPIKTFAIPNYDFYSVSFYGDNIINGVSKIFNTLNRGNIVKVGICGNELKRFAKSNFSYEKGQNSTDECGKHAVVITNKRRHHGSCQVKIRSSWGNQFGEQGSLWVNMQDFTKLLPYHDQQAMIDITIFELRGKRARENNTFQLGRGALYTGESIDFNPHGRGEVKSKYYSYSGTFHEGLHLTGIETYFDDHQNKTKEVKYKNGKIVSTKIY